MLIADMTSFEEEKCENMFSLRQVYDKWLCYFLFKVRDVC